MSTNDFDRTASLEIAKTLGLEVPQETVVQQVQVDPLEVPEVVEQPWYSKYTEQEIEELKRKAALVDLDPNVPVDQLTVQPEESIVDKLVREASEALSAEQPAENELKTENEPEQKSDVGEEWGRNVAKVALQRGYDAKQILSTLSDMPIEELVEVAAFKLKHLAQVNQQTVQPVAVAPVKQEQQKFAPVAEVKTSSVISSQPVEQVRQRSIFR